MKKKYVKPQAYFESFELNASIATGCSVIATLAENVCPAYDEDLGISVFVTKENCTRTVAPGDTKVCYNVPISGQNIFTS